MLSKKTIVHITYKISAGGLEQVLLQTVNGTPQYDHVILSITNVDQFKERFLPSTRFISLDKMPGSSLGVLKRGYSILKDIKPDIVHTYNLAGAEFLPVARLAGVKHTVHCEHGTPQTQASNQNTKLTLMRRLFLSFANHIIVVSHPLKTWLNKTVKVRADKITVVPNGVNTQVYKYIPFSPRPTFTIGTVARLSIEKNQQLLLQAFELFLSKVPAQAAKLCFLRIVGDGEQRRALEEQANAMSAKDNVTFVGNSDKVVEELQKFDLFVLSSVSEGMPMTILEAMSLGLPILSTDVGNISDVLHTSKGGVTVPSGDVDALAMHMMRFYEQQELRQQMGEKGSSYVQEHFAIQRMLSAYTAVYEA